MSYDEHEGDAADHGTKFPVTTLCARLITLASLVVSLAILHTNNVKISTAYVYTYTDFRSYRYMFYITLIGLAYTVLQLPLALYYVLRKKHLINRYAFLKFDFYADKVVLFLVATAGGAAFGTTSDLSTDKINWFDDEKMQDFFNVAYISAAFLILGCVAAAISSVHSSLALAKI